MKELHARLFNATFNLIINNTFFFNRSGPLQEYLTPDELRSQINFTLGESGHSHDQLLHELENCHRNELTHRPRALLEPPGIWLDPYAIAGDMLAASLSSVLLTFYAAPVFTLME